MTLNNIIDATVTNNNCVQPVGISTDLAVRQFGKDLPFRDQLKNVRGIDPQSTKFYDVSGTNWRVLPGKLQVKSFKADGPARDLPAYQALVRSDNGETLDVTSQQFKIHQNDEIYGVLGEMAAAGKAEIVYAGALDGGRKIVAIAKLEGEFDLPNKRQDFNNHAGRAENGEDKTALFAILSGGHEVGTPLKLRGMAFRLWCMNGAFFTMNAAATFTCSHRKRLTTAELVRLSRTYEEIRNQFDVYAQNATRLQLTEMQENQSRLLVAELLMGGANGVVAQLGEGLKALPSNRPLTAKEVYQEVENLEGRQLLNKIIVDNDAKIGRRGKDLLDAIANQHGSNGNNLWTGFNGVTYHVDHVRGRSAETGIDSAMFGEGATLKQEALTVALKFAN
jgi:hypothetical protein